VFDTLDNNKRGLFDVMRLPNIWALFFLGFSAGLPILLIFSSLSIWLKEAGVEKSSITLFSWAALAYSFKFIWAPLVDRLPLPVLARRLGQRRSWLLLAQCSIIVAINCMASVNPAEQSYALIFMALSAVLLGFSSATQDIVIDAYRIECDSKDMQGLLSASYTAGYRVGMIVAGAGALHLADFFGTSVDTYHYYAWQATYTIISLFMFFGVFTTLMISEPERAFVNDGKTRRFAAIFIAFICLALVFIAGFVGLGQLKLLLERVIWGGGASLSGLLAFIYEVVRLVFACVLVYLVFRLLLRWSWIDRDFFYQGYVLAVKSFFQSYGSKTALLLLAFIALYRCSDIVLGVVANLFYIDMGFSNTDIANASKVMGLAMAIVGGFIGGFCCLRYGVLRMLWVSSLLVMLTNLLFIVIFYSPELPFLYLVVAADNLAGGLATTAFIAFLSALVDVRFTAMQYAIFSSFMTLFPKLLGGYSGQMVESLGYVQFFSVTALLCVPVFILLLLMRGRIHIDD